MLNISKTMDWLSDIMYGKGHGLSILVPFYCADETNQRVANWQWLKRYWETQLPGAEVIIGKDLASLDGSVPFSKSVAINDAARHAKGDIFVIADADGYVPIEAVLESAHRIRKARRKNQRLWYVPYRHFYRLTEAAAQKVLQSHPGNPHTFSDIGGSEYVTNEKGSPFGHWYGALIQIMPREAFETVGGADPRFRGWGGEDHSLMHAVDTLWGRHKTLSGHVMHLWHPVLSPTVQSEWPIGTTECGPTRSQIR